MEYSNRAEISSITYQVIVHLTNNSSQYLLVLTSTKQYLQVLNSTYKYLQVLN